MTWIYRLLLIVLLGLAAASAGVAPARVSVERDGRAYTVSMVVDLDVPPEQVRAVLTDFEHLDRINPSILASEVLPSPDPDVTRVRTRVKSCAWFFCRKLDLVEDLRTAPNGDIHARVVAELSDMRAGSARWIIEGAGERTRLTYRSTMEPAFWVPPLLRSRAVTDALRKNLLATAANLQRLLRPAGGEDPQSVSPAVGFTARQP